MHLDSEYLVSSIPTLQSRSKVPDSLHVMARSCCLVHPATVFDQQVKKHVTTKFKKQNKTKKPNKQQKNPTQFCFGQVIIIIIIWLKGILL